MNCWNCGKVLPITKPLKPKDDVLVCYYCNATTNSSQLSWSDGKFHFNIVGDVRVENISPKVILKNQKAKVLDLDKIRRKSLTYIKQEPNLRAICGEFDIKSSDVRIEILKEEDEEN